MTISLPGANSAPSNYIHGDSLEGWWSIRNIMSGTGNLVIPDEQRPWHALDYGNIANYVYGHYLKAVSGCSQPLASNTLTRAAGSFVARSLDPDGCLARFVAAMK